MSLATQRVASADPAVNAQVSAGADQESTVIGRLFAGIVYGLPMHKKLAVEGHLAADVFLRSSGKQGIAARGFTLLDLGARYGIQSDRFVGPYVAVGGSYGVFTGKPHERKVINDAATCASANIPADQPQDECAFLINKNIAARFGLGWGFASGKKTTVGVRLDVTYWRFSVNDYEDQSPGTPIPRQIPRPQDGVSVMLGLEFLRWK